MEVVKVPEAEKISHGTKPILEGQTWKKFLLKKFPFKTIMGTRFLVYSRELETVAQVGKNGKKKITKVYKTIKGVKTADAPTVFRRSS